MMQSFKARWAIIIIVFIVCLIYFLPNVVSVGKNWPFSTRKIVYGLDIQGGLHLVMGVDVDGVMVERTARLAKTLGGQLTDQGVSFQSVAVSPSDPTELIVTLEAEEDEGKLQSFLDNFYPADLQLVGRKGLEAQLRYYDSRVAEIKRQVLDQAIEVIRNRIDEFGVAEPSISAQGDDRILVQLPGISDAVQAKELINRTARLEFRVVSDKMSPEELQSLIENAEKAGGYALGKDGLKYGAYVKRLNADLKEKLPADTKIVFEKSPNAVNLEAGKFPYLVETTSLLGGDQLEDANVRFDEYGKPEVVFRFSVDGRRMFAEMTRPNVGRLIAIVLDDVVQSAPRVNEAIDSDSAVITLGGRNRQEALNEAKFIATALRAGSLPAALEQLEERTVGPSLGADSITKAIQAGWIGAILVFVFMLVYYRFLGVVADISLAFNVFMTLAVLTALGATLTLPGVAGIVLNIGMAVDANVIIYERIKEELRKGVGLRAAVHDGFSNALSSIIDSNITTAAACVMLIYFGTGPVRGFAVTLIAGIVTSMFTAVFVSRTLLDFAVVKLKFQKLV